MNYYEHHLGDYAEATAHLSILEDGSYSRLLRKIYSTERALPEKTSEIYRLVGATKKTEKEAVDTVLAEFFYLAEDGYRNRRADGEIARFHEKQRKAKASADARWANRETQSDGNANASEKVMRSHSEGNAPRARSSPQSPDTSKEKENPPAARVTPKVKPLAGLKAWLEAVKAAGEKPVPSTDPVFAYADEVGIPSDFMHLAWVEFKHRYCQPDAKKYRDWRAVFRKAVRENWLKLWWLDGATYALTTAGMQAQRAQQARDQGT